MAEASDPVEKGLEELEKEVTCSICKEHFSCLDYCKDCIQQLRLTAPLYLSMLCPTTPCMGYSEARWGFEVYQLHHYTRHTLESIPLQKLVEGLLGI